MGVPKPGAPTYYWLDQIREIQNFVGPSESMYSDAPKLLQTWDYELLVTADFCAAAEPGNPPALTVADFQTDMWKYKMIQWAHQIAYWNLCDDA